MKTFLLLAILSYSLLGSEMQLLPAADSAQGLVLQCRREAYWMTSECPEDWLTRESSTEEAAFIEGNCTRSSNNLPPVSDRDTGWYMSTSIVPFATG